MAMSRGLLGTYWDWSEVPKAGRSSWGVGRSRDTGALAPWVTGARCGGVLCTRSPAEPLLAQTHPTLPTWSAAQTAQQPQVLTGPHSHGPYSCSWGWDMGCASTSTSLPAFRP